MVAVLSIMSRAVYVVALGCAAYAAWLALRVVQLAESAPQEAAGFAMAIAWAVIPYAGARAVEKLCSPLPEGSARAAAGVIFAGAGLFIAFAVISSFAERPSTRSHEGERPMPGRAAEPIAQTAAICAHWNGRLPRQRVDELVEMVRSNPELTRKAECSRRHAAYYVGLMNEWCDVPYGDQTLLFVLKQRLGERCP